MAPPEAPQDLSGALRAVWEVRQAEERKQYSLGAYQNIIFGVMAAVIFASYGAATALRVEGPLLQWLWLPPLLAAYTALAFATKSVLRLPRPTLRWGEVALGTGIFVGLMGLLALALVNGVLRDIPAGMSIVVGAFYVILGLVLVRAALPALVGAGVAIGAAALAVLGAGMMASTVYGIVVTSGAMVAMGLWMLRHPERGAPPPAEGEGRPPGELEQVRDTLAQVRGHEARVRAREAAAKTSLAAAVMALAGVTGLMTGAHPAPWLLLGVAGLTLLLGFVRQRASLRKEARHGA